MGRFIPKIVRADNSRIAPCIATADPSLLKECNAAHIMLCCQIIGCRKAMPSPTDDDDIVLTGRFRASPCFSPILMIINRISGQTKYGITIFLHTVSVAITFKQIVMPAGATSSENLAADSSTRHLHLRPHDRRESGNRVRALFLSPILQPTDHRCSREYRKSSG